MSTMGSITCAALVMLAFVVAGLAQTVFLKSAVSSRFAWPIDGGRSLGGRRIFGDNKTLRGFVVMLPAVTLCFAAVGLGASRGVFGGGVWPLTTAEWALLGLAAALGYTLGELPNSFVKRRLGIPPGEHPAHPIGRRVVFVVDQLDSIVAAMGVIALLVPTGWVFWAVCLGAGAVLHWLFNVLLHVIGVKRRAA